MGNDNRYDDLIVRYLQNELTAEEEAELLEWTNSSEQNRQYFDKLIKTWSLTGLSSLRTINIDDEWRQFEQKIFFKESASEQAPALIDLVEDRKTNKKTSLYKFFIATAVAASLILALGLNGLLFNQDESEGKQFVEVQVKKKADTVPAIARREINTSRKTRTFVLQDGTVVTLAGRSEVSFYEPFIDNRRDITLKGKAHFTVAKDKVRPFTVYSGKISTTALGTRFLVRAFENENLAVVRLFEGKVVVKPHDKVSKRQKNNYYLLPGQELIYNNRLSTATVRRFNDAVAPTKNINEKLFVDTLSMPANEKGSWFMFNNQPLHLVFRELQNIYDVEIVYTKKDVANMYFIGRFNRTDSVENVLHQIAAVNNLKISKKNNRFFIKAR